MPYGGRGVAQGRRSAGGRLRVGAGGFRTFLSGALNALEPVLRWRALPAERGGTFGTVSPSPEEYTEAEEAVRRLQDALARIST